MKDFNSGQFISKGYYKSFQPNRINRQWNIDNMEIISAHIHPLMLEEQYPIIINKMTAIVEN